MSPPPMGPSAIVCRYGSQASAKVAPPSESRGARTQNPIHSGDATPSSTTQSTTLRRCTHGSEANTSGVNVSSTTCATPRVPRRPRVTVNTLPTMADTYTASRLSHAQVDAVRAPPLPTVTDVAVLVIVEASGVLVMLTLFRVASHVSKLLARRDAARRHRVAQGR